MLISLFLNMELCCTRFHSLMSLWFELHILGGEATRLTTWQQRSKLAPARKYCCKYLARVITRQKKNSQSLTKMKKISCCNQPKPSFFAHDSIFSSFYLKNLVKIFLLTRFEEFLNTLQYKKATESSSFHC